MIWSLRDLEKTADLKSFLSLALPNTLLLSHGPSLCPGAAKTSVTSVLLAHIRMCVHTLVAVLVGVAPGAPVARHRGGL